MTIDELKQTIESKTGVPAAAIGGDTAPEVIQSARALLDFKMKHERQAPKSKQELFAGWLDTTMGTHTAGQDPRQMELDALQEQARVEAGGYPRVKDAGELDYRRKLDGVPNAEKFKEWFCNQIAEDPCISADGWKRII